MGTTNIATHFINDRCFCLGARKCINNIKKQKKIRDHFLNEQNRLLRIHDLLPSKSQNPRARRLVELNLNNDDALLTFNNEVETFIDGQVLFPNLIKNIEEAKRSINVEFYTFYDDQLGNHAKS